MGSGVCPATNVLSNIMLIHLAFLSVTHLWNGTSISHRVNMRKNINKTMRCLEIIAVEVMEVSKTESFLSTVCFVLYRIQSAFPALKISLKGRSLHFCGRGSNPQHIATSVILLSLPRERSKPNATMLVSLTSRVQAEQ